MQTVSFQKHNIYCGYSLEAHRNALLMSSKTYVYMEKWEKYQYFSAEKKKSL